MNSRENTRVLAFVYGGYLVRYIYLIVVVPFYGRVLGVTEYGRVLAAMSLMNVIWMLVTYGFSFAGMREVSKAKTRAEHNAIFSLHCSSRILVALICGLIGLVATYSSPVLAERPTIGILATVLGIVSGLNLSWFFQGRQQFRTPIMLEVLGFSLSLGLILSLVKGPADSSWVLGSLLIAATTATAIGYGLTVAEFGWPRIRLSGVGQLVRDSTLLFCYSSGSVILTAFSTYLLTLLSTPSEVGYFGAAERFAAVGLSLMGPAAQVFIPTITRQLSQGDHDGARTSTRRGAVLLFGYGLLALCAVLTLSPLLLPRILGEAFAPSTTVLQCFGWMFPFAAFNQFVAFYLLVPRKMDRSLAIAGVTSGLVNLAAALYLVPRHGAMGMALARVLGEATLSILLLGLAARSGLLTGVLHEGAGRAFARVRLARGVGGESGKAGGEGSK